MELTGDWDLTIKTPIGSLAVVYSFADDGTGTATGWPDTPKPGDCLAHR